LTLRFYLFPRLPKPHPSAFPQMTTPGSHPNLRKASCPAHPRSHASHSRCSTSCYCPSNPSSPFCHFALIPKYRFFSCFLYSVNLGTHFDHCKSFRAKFFGILVSMRPACLACLANPASIHLPRRREFPWAASQIVLGRARGTLRVYE